MDFLILLRNTWVVSVVGSVKSKTFISYLEEETEADPLVVFMVSSFVGIYGFIHTGMCYVDTDSFPESTRNCVRGMNPAICVEHIFWYVISMDTVYGVSDVLSCCHY